MHYHDEYNTLVCIAAYVDGFYGYMVRMARWRRCGRGDVDELIF